MEAKKLDPTQRVGKYRDRVFIGGSYHREIRSRLENIKASVKMAGFEPVVADEVQLENVEDIHHETMVLLHTCRLAIFELSQLSGALMEIERVPDYGIHALILFVDPDKKGYPASRMLSTFVVQHEATIQLRPYVRVKAAERYVSSWLNTMRKRGFG